MADEAIINQVTAANGRARAPIQADHQDAKERSYAVHFICGSCFTNYKRHLKNMMLEGNDRYPTTLLDAYTILQCWDDGIALTTNTGSSGAVGDDGDATNNNQYVFAQ